VADYPDIYADGFTLAAGRFGVTLTFNISQPTGEADGREDPTDPVVRLRLGRELAKALVESLTQMLAAYAQEPQGGSPVKH
jgi:hypothetical protein